MSDRSAVFIQGCTLQKQQHLYFPQSSFPMYGAGSFHPQTARNVATSSTMGKPRAHDSQTCQGHIHQGLGSAHTDYVSQAMNVMNVPKIERQNFILREFLVLLSLICPLLQGHIILLFGNLWYVESNKIGSLPYLGYLKQECAEQFHDKQQPEPSVFSSPGSTMSDGGLIGQGKTVSGISNDKLSEGHHSGLAFSLVTSTTTMTPLSSALATMPSSADTNVQIYMEIKSPPKG